MEYKLSDRELSELCLFISVREITRAFPSYTPSPRTIYRRLEKHGIKHPSLARDNFRLRLLKSAPLSLSDTEAKALIEQEIQALFVELCASIERRAEEYRGRFE